MSFLSKTGVFIENFLGIDGLDIYWYGMLIASAFLIAYFITNFLCKKRGYKKDLTTDMLIICIITDIYTGNLNLFCLPCSTYDAFTHYRFTHFGEKGHYINSHLQKSPLTVL